MALNLLLGAKLLRVKLRADFEQMFYYVTQIRAKPRSVSSLFVPSIDKLFLEAVDWIYVAVKSNQRASRKLAQDRKMIVTNSLNSRHDFLLYAEVDTENDGTKIHGALWR